MKTTDRVKLVTVGKYGDSVLANIMRAKLEAAGIDSVLMDENSVNIVTINPDYTHPFGDIKLQVREEDEEKAREILTITTDTLTEEDVTDEGVTCPHCGSKDTVVALGYANIFAAAWALFVSSLPFYSKKRYYCNSCKKYFKAKPKLDE